MEKGIFKQVPIHKPKYPVQTLEKALEIIELLSAQETDEGVGISELSNALDLGKSTVHRLLDTLTAYQYVEKSSEGKYRLGWRLFQIGNVLPRQRKINNIDVKILKQLSEKVEETVNLAVREGKDAVIVYKIDPDVSNRIKVDFRVGEREPFHCTALGKVLFSEIDESYIKSIVEEEGLSRLTENTITKFDTLKEELRKVRNAGYALDEGELSQGLSCIAMPVRNYTGDIVAAVSVSGPSFRLGASKILTVKEALTETTWEISKTLGYFSGELGESGLPEQ